MGNKAPVWTLVLFIAPLGFAALAVILDAVLQKTCQRWRKYSNSDYKRRSALVALIKAMVFATCLGLAIPVFLEVASTWGREPTWLKDATLSTYFNVSASLLALVYVFELTFRSGLGYDLWLHHTASIVPAVISVTGVFLAESEQQRALMSSWAICAGVVTGCNTVFFLALFAYGLQLDNFLAKKRLALFFFIFSVVVNLGIVIVPLAYTASAWGLLTVTSKAIMLTALAAFLPTHTLAARTFWSIYCLNKGRVDELLVLPVVVAHSKDPAAPAGSSWAMLLLHVFDTQEPAQPLPATAAGSG